jgi:hypothetical protein
MLVPNYLTLLAGSVSIAFCKNIPRNLVTAQPEQITERAPLGYKFNSFGLVVESITATRKFYGDALGFIELFSFNASTDFTALIMGDSQGGGAIEFLYLRVNNHFYARKNRT